MYNTFKSVAYLSSSAMAVELPAYVSNSIRAREYELQYTEYTMKPDCCGTQQNKAQLAYIWLWHKTVVVCRRRHSTYVFHERLGDALLVDGQSQRLHEALLEQPNLLDVGEDDGQTVGAEDVRSLAQLVQIAVDGMAVVS